MEANVQVMAIEEMEPIYRRSRAPCAGRRSA